MYALFEDFISGIGNSFNLANRTLQQLTFFVLFLSEQFSKTENSEREVVSERLGTVSINHREPDHFSVELFGVGGCGFGGLWVWEGFFEQKLWKMRLYERC